MNLFCPVSGEYDSHGTLLAGPHNFEWSEGRLIFCSYCGECRELDPNAGLPAAPPSGPQQSFPPKPQGNGIFPP